MTWKKGVCVMKKIISNIAMVCGAFCLCSANMVSAFDTDTNLNIGIIKGDIDNNARVDLTDLTELSLALLGDRELSVDGQKAADVDGDGDITLADLARLRQYLSKVIPSLGDTDSSDKPDIEPVSPPVIDSDTTVFEVGSLAQYTELKYELTQDDTSLEKFFKTLSSGKKDRETANVFVKHVDSLSVLDFFPGKITWIRYEKSEKEDNYETVQITIQSDSAGWIRYCYYIPSDENAVPFPDTDQSSVFEEPLQNDDGSIKLFSKSVNRTILVRDT